MSLRLGYGESAASLRVLALVSGMPAPARMSRELMMLQAYIDESCTDGALFVMAGYVATVEQWLAFSDEWADLLRLGPPHYRNISEFKQSAMKSQVGLEQSEHFYRVIERHLHTYVTCSIKLADLREAFESIAWPDWLDNLDMLTNEHFSAFESIVKGLAIDQHRLGLHGPIDVIFDNHSNKVNCLKAWDYLKRDGHPSIRAMLGDTPVFRDSETTMPLQAADMLAHWLRDCQMKPGRDPLQYDLEFPWAIKSKAMTGLHIYFTPQMIRKNFQNILLACVLGRAGVPRDIVSVCVSPRLARPAR